MRSRSRRPHELIVPASRNGPPPAAAQLLLALLAILTPALLLASCGGPVLSIEQQQRFEDASRTQSVEATIGEEVESLALELSLDVDRGQVRYRVLDPQGSVQWRGEIGAGGKVQDSRDFQPVAGPWRLELDFQGATGRYEARWQGH